MLQGFGAGININDAMNWINGKLVDSGYIGDADFSRIAAWGMDHVRISIRYDSLIKRPEEERLDDDNIRTLDHLVEQAINHHLNVILDLHVGPGYTHINANGQNGGNPFLEDKGLQDKFCNFWGCMAEHYKPFGERVMFELLNEVVEEPSSRWNNIAARAIAVIRRINAQQKILYGGIHYNSIHKLCELDVTEDPNIVYGFHFYEPILFTHQTDLIDYCIKYAAVYGKMSYPGLIPYLDEFIQKNPQYTRELERFVGSYLDKNLIYREMEPAAAFLNKHPNASLYCGEFGAIKHVDTVSKREWLRDVTGRMNELGIGHSCWAYTDTPDGWFAFVDWNTREPLDPQTMEICARMPRRR